MTELTRVQELASPVVAAASLVEIRLFESTGRHVKFPSEPEHVSASDIDVSIESAGGSSTAMYLLRADIAMQEHKGGMSDEDPADVATFSVTFGALYALNEAAQLNEEQREAFGQCVASLALWPYVRAELARLSEQMHFPNPLTLPMLSQRDILELAD